jgi:hypothetical protein
MSSIFLLVCFFLLSIFASFSFFFYLSIAQVVDMGAAGARDAALDLLASAKAEGARAVVCASPSGSGGSGYGGERATALVLASYCMAEYGTAPDEVRTESTAHFAFS